MSGITTLVTTPLIKDFYKTEICVQICSIPINTLMHNVEMFFGKSVLKICSRFTKEHPCRSVISIHLQSIFIEITLWHGCSPANLLHIFRIPFTKNTSERLLLKYEAVILALTSVAKEMVLRM